MFDLRDLTTTQTHHDEEIFEYLSGSNLPIVIFGVKETAKSVAETLIRNGIDGFYFCTDLLLQKHEINILGQIYPILTIDNLNKTFSDGYDVIPGFIDGLKKNFFSQKYYQELFKNLNRIIMLSEIYDVEKLDRKYLSDNLSLFEETLNLFQDKLSIESYKTFIYGKVTGDINFIDRLMVQPEYFQRDIYHLPFNSVFIDCGAYDGDSIKGFLDFTMNTYSKIIAFEPDEIYFKKLLQYIKVNSVKDIIAMNKGVSDSSKFQKFTLKNAAGSKIAEYGENTIETCRIDDCLVTCVRAGGGGGVNLIKMELEGPERPALYGAIKTIQRDKPVLAISAYHKAADLITIPQFIKKAVPEYRFYFRLHKPCLIDAVLYAV